MIEVEVAKLGIDMNSKVPVIILKEIGGEKAVLLQIGLFEFQAIALALRKVRPPRPLTHDLVILLIEGLKGKVDRVVITNFINNAFYVRILIRSNGENIEVDSRPSDAIALALRVKAPIFINETVFNKVALGTKPISDKEIEDFEKRLKDLKPENFTG